MFHLIMLSIIFSHDWYIKGKIPFSVVINVMDWNETKLQYDKDIKKSLKVFRLKAAILGLRNASPWAA